MARYVLPSPVLSLPLLLVYTVSPTFCPSPCLAYPPNFPSIYTFIQWVWTGSVAPFFSLLNTHAQLKGNAVEDDGDLSSSAMHCITDMLDRAGTSQHSVKTTIKSHTQKKSVNYTDSIILHMRINLKPDFSLFLVSKIINSDLFHSLIQSWFGLLITRRPHSHRSCCSVSK